MIRTTAWLIPALFMVMACHTPRGTQTRDDGKLHITLLQINDVYEIAPLEGGKVGGMARVATIKKEYLRKNPNTFLIMAGDFLSPSVYNGLSYEGTRIRGRQMVDAMNVAGVDFAVFGNHEFDITETELQSRLNESQFQWVASNTFHQQASGVAYFKKISDTGMVEFPTATVLNLTDADGTRARIGIIGTTLPFNKASYVSYTDPLETAKRLYDSLAPVCDAVIALTHQLMEDDILLAQELPGLALIAGGHEHDMRYQQVGPVLITKAHANARTLYALDLTINVKNKKRSVASSLIAVDDQVAIDSSTHAVVQKWIDIADQNYSRAGFNAAEIIRTSGDPLDGREAAVRNASTNFTELITKAMAAAAPDADLVLLNSGSIRVDDILHMPITQFDILRSLPYGGSIREVDMKGSLLLQVLEAGNKNRGLGGFLQFYPVEYDRNSATFLFGGKPIEAERSYRVALNDFLLSGNEVNLNFLNPQNPAITKVYPEPKGIENPCSDVRLAIVQYLKASER